jgi:hypothetical protein
MSDAFDESILNELYCKSPSVVAKIKEVHRLLKNSGLKKSKATSLVQRLVPMLIPAGTKSKIRGDIFNKIVLIEIKKCLRRCSTKKFKLCVEKKHENVQEIPDWYIKNTSTGQTLIGYNQMDLWNGGHQINRAGKYIMDDTLHRRLANKGISLCCVVYNKCPKCPKVLSKTSKIISYGTKTKRFVYIKDLKQIIRNFTETGS